MGQVTDDLVQLVRMQSDQLKSQQEDLVVLQMHFDNNVREMAEMRDLNAQSGAAVRRLTKGLGDIATLLDNNHYVVKARDKACRLLAGGTG